MRHGPILSLMVKILPYAVAAAVVAAVIIATVWIVFPSTIEDLIPNLMAELIGIFLTVGLISTLVSLMEEQRRLPSKCLVYAELLKLTDEFLLVVLPEPLRDLEVRTYKYRHADIYASSVLAPLDEAVLSRLPELIAQDIGNRDSFDLKPFVDLKKDLDLVLHRSIDLLDPGPRSLLLRLVFVQLKELSVDIEQNVPMYIPEPIEEPKVASNQGCMARFRHFFGRSSVKQTEQWNGGTKSPHTSWISGEDRNKIQYIEKVIGVVYAMVKLRIWLQRVLSRHFAVTNMP